jgi:hypothetical protein
VVAEHDEHDGRKGEGSRRPLSEEAANQGADPEGADVHRRADRPGTYHRPIRIVAITIRKAKATAQKPAPSRRSADTGGA